MPKGHKEDSFNLYSWVNKQRVRKTTFTAERIQMLDGVGFVWNTYSNDWEKAYIYLNNFYIREGHTKVPISHKENKFPLGVWVKNQKYRKSNLSIDQIDRLVSIGFEWHNKT